MNRKTIRAIAATGLATAIALGYGAVQGKADETMVSRNLVRNGWDPSEPSLTPAVVSGSTFGQIFTTTVNGQIDAQPLKIGNALIVVTETNRMYSLNASTGAVNWGISLGPAWPSAANGCADINPSIGVTSTPVYDSASHEIYVTAVLNNGTTVKTPHVVLKAIALTTGHTDWQAQIQGTPVNDPSHRPFNSFTQRQRAGLLLMNGHVFIGFASYCDFKPYTGLIASVSTATTVPHAVSLWTDEARGVQAGIWMGDSGLMSDAPGRIFVASGNGSSPPAAPGTSPPATLSESVIRVNVQTNGSLIAKDFFAPANAPYLDAHDVDLGSGGPIGLPFGTALHPHLLLQAGKDGRLFILDRASLGGRNATTDHPVSISGPYGGQAGHPSAFAGTGGSDYVYYQGSRMPLRVLKFSTVNASLTSVGVSADVFPGSSGSPAVTSNGTDPSTAVVWVVKRAGTTSVLEAFAGVPQNGVLRLLRSFPIGTAAKFTNVATDGGRVYLGTNDGKVYGFGVTTAAPASVTAPPVAQPPVPAANVAPPLSVYVSTNYSYGEILVTPSVLTVYRPAGGKAGNGYEPLLAIPSQPVTLPPSLSRHHHITTVLLPDGSHQLAYDGQPLYTFSGDKHPGDAFGAGQHWRVVPSDA